MFATAAEVLHWLDGLRARRERLDPTLDNPDLLTVITDAVRYAGTLHFDGSPIERVLIAQASGLLPDVVNTLLDETE